MRHSLFLLAFIGLSFSIYDALHDYIPVLVRGQQHQAVLAQDTVGGGSLTLATLDSGESVMVQDFCFGRCLDSAITGQTVEVRYLPTTDRAIRGSAGLAIFDTMLSISVQLLFAGLIAAYYMRRLWRRFRRPTVVGRTAH